ncbi:GGDEF domain-containing phosphodiesterase [Novosphingobium sp.]|uniref:GGDEF domain-containing phosphodiesterase n=1 Tax=Novosphingobium sp. TaxID=1874826 RepID=UPI0025F17CF8|nr:GGDEF domain-containing phosphodiesterase [Novosphingobium sp.]MCC6925757.1 EAL domain-containing protein [Novosphingobium sp.]
MSAMHPDHFAAKSDPLTGLAGREAAAARLGEWLGHGEKVHALLIGLRRFDALNLAYGTAAGDMVLGEVAQRLKHFAADELEGAWLAARSGGDEFLLLATEPCSRERWQLAAGQLLEALARPIATSWGTMRLSPRGALLRGIEGDNAATVLDRLGQTLDQAMGQSARRLVWADGEATRSGLSAAQLEADLLHALDRGEIEVFYQPQFSCRDDRLTGGEALARWNHPSLGRIGAGALFAIAERADHVAQLSQHIARLALQGARDWPMDLRLSLNVTPNDLASPAFALDFGALVKRSKFPAWRLTLEVTEQVLLADVAHASLALGELARQGMRIALDDFGAGFCNFRYLKLLPLHYLKLDRSMIEGVAGDARDLAVLRAILAMAGALDLKVIAEGVENEAQRALAASEGCAFYQGFLRAQPMGAAEFLELARG